MSTIFYCDGCGKAIDATIKIGHVTKRDYCKACSERAQEFVEPEEMREILSNRSLVRRLRRGSRDARVGRGRRLEIARIPDAPSIGSVQLPGWSA
ncbi:MAG: hypothetical protein AAB368_13820 [bacterium]